MLRWSSSRSTPPTGHSGRGRRVAGLLDAFNREYDTPTPGNAVLATRLGRLLASGDVVALLTGDPAALSRC